MEHDHEMLTTFYRCVSHLPLSPPPRGVAWLQVQLITRFSQCQKDVTFEEELITIAAKWSPSMEFILVAGTTYVHVHCACYMAAIAIYSMVFITLHHKTCVHYTCLKVA